jgi:ATP-binding cassette subfamily C (CFTR/MRP) protein 1
VEEGNFSDLMKNQKYITSLGIKKRGKGVTVDTVVNESDSQIKIPESTAKEDDNDKARQLGDISVYVFYFSIIGLGLLVPYLLFGMAFSFLSSFSTIWLEFWSSATEQGKYRYSFLSWDLYHDPGPLPSYVSMFHGR